MALLAQPPLAASLLQLILARALQLLIAPKSSCTSAQLTRRAGRAPAGPGLCSSLVAPHRVLCLQRQALWSEAAAVVRGRTWAQPQDVEAHGQDDAAGWTRPPQVPRSLGSSQTQGLGSVILPMGPYVLLLSWVRTPRTTAGASPPSAAPAPEPASRP